MTKFKKGDRVSYSGREGDVDYLSNCSTPDREVYYIHVVFDDDRDSYYTFSSEQINLWGRKLIKSKGSKKIKKAKK